jgi:hypothetical protein
MLSFLSRSHLPWLILFCGAVLSMPKVTSLPLVHLTFIAYSLWYLFVPLPLFISRTLTGKTWSFIDTFFIGLIFFFFFFVPFFYTTTKLHITSLQSSNILLSLIGIIFICYLYPFFKKPERDEALKVDHFHIKKETLLLFAALLLFATLHLIYFYFYQFLPEWDGYTDILSIEKNLETATFQQSYRAFFQASASILSSLLVITPYNLFLYFFIPLQITPLLVLYRLFQRYTFSHTLWQAILYISFISIPVVAMEIGMVRPQNILIIFVPIIFYLLLVWEKEKDHLFLLLLLLILISGLRYHEFFWFFLIATPALFSLHLYEKRAFLKKPLILILVTLGTILFLTFLFLASNTLRTFAMKVLLDVSDITHWRWWFLNNYNNSAQANTEVGWSGLIGTIQYYGYYLSPIIAALVFFLATQWKKLTSSHYLSQKSTLYFGALLCIWITFAEILPRLNSPFIPERYWLFFCLTLFFFFTSFLLHHKEIALDKTLLIILLLACFFGISASVYIAYTKKSLTTKEEYQAALWIKNTLPKDAIIISQPGNGPLIRNFANKEIFIPKEDFFLAERYISPGEKMAPERLSRMIESLEKQPSLQNKYTIVQIKRVVAEQEKFSKRPLYILYSNQKFSTIYSKRGWYLNQNFYQARLEKFDAHLERVYDQNGIILWKIH